MTTASSISRAAVGTGGTGAPVPFSDLSPQPVWDRIVRSGHWVLAISFIIAFISHESERWRLVHVVSGYVVFATVALRVLWGVVGTRHARFASFVRAPGHAISYFKTLFGKHPEHHTGHNPAGGWAVVGLLGLSALASVTGWMTYNNLGGPSSSEWHERASDLAVLLVIVHVAAVVLSSCLHKENLVRAMFTGLRRGTPSERIQDVSVWKLCAYLGGVAALSYWAFGFEV
jgi:cytochrome b